MWAMKMVHPSKWRREDSSAGPQGKFPIARAILRAARQSWALNIIWKKKSWKILKFWFPHTDVPDVRMPKWSSRNHKVTHSRHFGGYGVIFRCIKQFLGKIEISWIFGKKRFFSSFSKAHFKGKNTKKCWFWRKYRSKWVRQASIKSVYEMKC